jgi:hypothetical protein
MLYHLLEDKKEERLRYTSLSTWILSHLAISEVELVLKIQISLVVGQIAILDPSLFQAKEEIPGKILFTEACIFTMILYNLFSKKCIQ